MEQYFSNLFEDKRYERSIIIILSLMEPETLKQSELTDVEINILKDLALDKIHRQRILKEIVAMDLLDKQFSDWKMSTHPKINNEPELLKIKTRDDEIKNWKYQTEKHDHENILQSLKVDNEYLKKSTKNGTKRKYY